MLLAKTREFVEDEALAREIAEKLYLDILVSIAIDMNDYLPAVPADCCHSNASTDCTGKADGIYPVASCCQYYLQCSAGEGTLEVRNLVYQNQFGRFLFFTHTFHGFCFVV